MTLTLDHTQRLNLHALLGAQRADVGSIRAIWSIQDRIALDADEETSVELKRERVAGQERVVWNPALSVPAKDFEFTDSEVARIKGVIETWDAYNAAADRCWLEPLVEALFCATPQELRWTEPQQKRHRVQHGRKLRATQRSITPILAP
jgi:hypothetical protein